MNFEIAEAYSILLVFIDTALSEVKTKFIGPFYFFLISVINFTCVTGQMAREDITATLGGLLSRGFVELLSSSSASPEFY